MDIASPLTSGAGEVSIEGQIHAGRDTSQQSEGSSSTKIEQHIIDSIEDDDKYDQPGPSSFRAQKRKRKPGISDLSDDEYSHASVSGLERESKKVQVAGLSPKSGRRDSTGSSTSSKEKRHNIKDHTIHSASDDLPFTASLGSVGSRRRNPYSASQERESKRMQVDGIRGEKDTSAHAWSVRLKRQAAQRISSYQDHEDEAYNLDENAPIEADGPAPPAKRKYTRKQAINATNHDDGAVGADATSTTVPEVSALQSQWSEAKVTSEGRAMANVSSDGPSELDGQVQPPKKKRGRPPWKHLVKAKDGLVEGPKQSIEIKARRPYERKSLEVPNSTEQPSKRKLGRPFKKKAAEVQQIHLDIDNDDDDDDTILDMTISTTSVQPAKSSRFPRREAASKIINYYVAPLDDDDSNIVSRSPPSKPKRSFNATVAKSKKAVHDFDPVSYDSLFAETDPISYDSLFDADAILLSDREVALGQHVLDESGKVTTTSTSGKRRTEGAKKRKTKGANEELTVIEKNGKTYIPQYYSCQRQLNFQQCRQCVAKKMGDTCRFVGLRGLPAFEQDGKFKIGTNYTEEEEGPIFIDDVTLSEQVVLPDHYDLNRPMDEDSKIKIMTTTATSLVCILREGLDHANKPGCIRRARELQIRALCDFCSTGLFSASYLCTICGGEYCLPCKADMEAEAGSQNYLFTCVKNKLGKSKQLKKGGRSMHTSDMMIPVSRFSIQELQEELAAMEHVIEEHGSSMLTSTMRPKTEKDDVSTLQPTQPTQNGTTIPSHLLTIESKDIMDQEQFLSTWAKGEPLVVTEVCTRNVWNPKVFVEKYGEMDCEIIRCDERAPFMLDDKVVSKLKTNPYYFRTWEKAVKVHEFFKTFGKPDEERAATFGKGIWKLKDWPPAAEFSTEFPDIYEDFNYAVPMPDFTRRDGCINISSLFPKNANGPDLGPKMYNAWPGEHTKGKKGTTCLHMDIADAVNILLYTAEREGVEQAAQWDIFRAEDANAIRDFLREKNPKDLDKGDPIHAQIHYLDDDSLLELYNTKGVYSWRLLQRSGQAVFIPAGCAHQVCNLTDCIKVAVDFISPQNVARCFQLTEEFRGLSLEGRKSWKEDVLQLKAQLWYAWKACRTLRPTPTEEEFECVSMVRRARKEKQQQNALGRRQPLRATRNGSSTQYVNRLNSVSLGNSPEKGSEALEDNLDQIQTSEDQSNENIEAQTTSEVVPEVVIEDNAEPNREGTEMDRIIVESGDVVMERIAYEEMVVNPVGENVLLVNETEEALTVKEDEAALDLVKAENRAVVEEHDVEEEIIVKEIEEVGTKAEEIAAEEIVATTLGVEEVAVHELTAEECIPGETSAEILMEIDEISIESSQEISEPAEQTYESADETPAPPEGPEVEIKIESAEESQHVWDGSPPLTPPRPDSKSPSSISNIDNQLPL